MQPLDGDPETTHQRGATAEDTCLDARGIGRTTYKMTANFGDQFRPYPDAAAQGHHLRIENRTNRHNGGGAALVDGFSKPLWSPAS